MPVTYPWQSALPSPGKSTVTCRRSDERKRTGQLLHLRPSPRYHAGYDGDVTIPAPPPIPQ